MDRSGTDNAGLVDALSAVFSGLSNVVVDHSDNNGACAPDTTLHPSEHPDPNTQREGATNCATHSVSRDPKLGPSAEPDTDRVIVGHTETEIDSSLVIKDDRSSISGLLKPILDFMTCPEVFRFLKSAEAHPGLRSTQLFDLFWVADNLFDVHGGVRSPLLVEGVISSKSPIDFDVWLPKIFDPHGRYFWNSWLKRLVSRYETYAEARWDIPQVPSSSHRHRWKP